MSVYLIVLIWYMVMVTIFHILARWSWNLPSYRGKSWIWEVIYVQMKTNEICILFKNAMSRRQVVLSLCCNSFPILYYTQCAIFVFHPYYFIYWIKIVCKEVFNSSCRKIIIWQIISYYVYKIWVSKFDSNVL